MLNKKENFSNWYKNIDSENLEKWRSRKPCEIIDIKAYKILIIWVTLQNEDNWSKAEAETGVLQNYGHKRNVARHVDVVIRDQMSKIKRDYTFISENIH